MRLTIRSDLALRTLAFCAAQDDRLVTKAEIARLCNASENHLAQVIHALGHAGYLETRRGRSGGIRLGRPPEAIGIGQVLRHFEAEVPFTECFSPAQNTCPLAATCVLKAALLSALNAFYSSLDALSLADLVAQPEALAHLRNLSGTKPLMACPPEASIRSN